MLRRLLFYQRLILQPKAHTQYVALLFHKFEFESEAQCDQEGRIHFQVASPWLFQMHQDFDTLFSVVDDLSLDANVIDQRFGAMFSTHESDTHRCMRP